jgi:hypothetical protein
MYLGSLIIQYKWLSMVYLVHCSFSIEKTKSVFRMIIIGYCYCVIFVWLQRALQGFQELSELYVSGNPFSVSKAVYHTDLHQMLPALHILDGVRHVNIGNGLLDLIMDFIV